MKYIQNEEKLILHDKTLRKDNILQIKSRIDIQARWLLFRIFKYKKQDNNYYSNKYLVKLNNNLPDYDKYVINLRAYDV